MVSRVAMDNAPLLSLVARAKRHTVAVTVSSGREVRLHIQSVGADWISGFPADGRDTALVIRVAAVMWVCGLSVTGSAEHESLGNAKLFRPPLWVLLSNLLHGNPVLSVHFRNHSVKGWLIAQGGDFAVLGRRGEQDLVIPLESIEWFEVL